LLQFANFFLLR